jgi:uncharacterized protein involved in outer membrane biogenesis
MIGLIIVGALVTVYIVLSTYDYNHLKPRIALAFKEATGRELSLAGNISLRIGLAPTLAVENVGVQNASWGSQPEMAQIKRFELQVALIPLIFGSVDVKRLILIDSDLLIEVSNSGKSNLDFIKKTEAPSIKEEERAKEKVKLTLHEVRLESGRITYRNDKSHKTHVVTVDRLTATAGGAASPLELRLKGSYNQEPFEITGTLGPLAALTSSGEPWPVDLSLKAAGANLTLAGTVKEMPKMKGIDIRFRANGKDLSTVSHLLSKPLPLKGPFDGSGRFTELQIEIYKISDLKAELGGSDLTGSAELDLSSRRPLVKAGLLSKKFDFRPLFAGRKEKPGPAEGSGRAGPEAVFPDHPLPWDALKEVDATVNFQASEVLAPHLAAQNLTVKITLEDGRLMVKPLKALVGGGTFDGYLGASPQGKVAEVATAMKIEHLELAAVAKDLNVSNVNTGLIDVNVNVRARGGSIAGLMAGLDGRTVLVMRHGRIGSEYIDLLGADLSSSIFRLLDPFRVQPSYTPIDCLVSGFSIRNGLADTTALVVNTKEMSVVGDGYVNLRTEGLDVALKAFPRGGIKTGVAGKVSLSLGELTQPFRLAGTLAHPSLAVNLNQTAITVGKEVGGVLLFGPAGALAGLVEKSSGEKDLCSVAIEAAQKGVKLSFLETQKKKGVLGEASENVEREIGAAGKELQRLLGK